jgi:cytosine/adenosine deaminase-related metal-dependent hydrolase
MLITNATLITWEQTNQVLPDHAVLIRGGRIAERGQYVMPGNICAHTHFYDTFARGLAIPGPAPKDFPEILQKLWWPLDEAEITARAREQAPRVWERYYQQFQ